MRLRDRPVATSGFEHDRREHRRELGRRQPVPRSGPQTFGDQEVALAVDPSQQSAGVGGLEIGGGEVILGAGVDEAPLGQQSDDAVEGPGQ